MKKRLQGLIIGLVIGVMISSVVTFAKSGTDLIEAWYSDIKIFINGQKINPTDVNGNTVEPFIYNGTTYLPVRAVGNSLGMDVDWDNDTKTVFLGEKPVYTNSDERIIAEFVDNYGYQLEKNFEEGFSTSGMSCECNTSTKGTVLVIECLIDGVDNLSEYEKNIIANSANAYETKSSYKESLKTIQTGLPVTGIELVLCEQDGDVITTIYIN